MEINFKANLSIKSDKFAFFYLFLRKISKSEKILSKFLNVFLTTYLTTIFSLLLNYNMLCLLKNVPLGMHP